MPLPWYAAGLLFFYSISFARESRELDKCKCKTGRKDGKRALVSLTTPQDTFNAAKEDLPKKDVIQKFVFICSVAHQNKAANSVSTENSATCCGIQVNKSPRFFRKIPTSGNTEAKWVNPQEEYADVIGSISITQYTDALTWRSIRITGAEAKLPMPYIFINNYC